MLKTAIIAALLVVTGFRADTPQFKAGDVVLLKNDNAQLHVEEDGQVMSIDADQIHYTVISQAKDKIKIRNGDGVVAMLDAEDVILLKEAVAFFTKQLAADATADGYIRRGYANKLQDQFEKAIADFTEAIKLEPEDTSVWSHRADAYSENKEPDKAIADFTKAIDIDGEYGYGYIGRGNALVEKKEYDKAMKDFDKALDLNPKDSFAIISRGNVFLEKKEYDKAIAEYNEAIEITPNSSYAFICRGNAKAGKKDYERAIKDYDKAIQFDPLSSSAFASRGSTQADMRNYEKAIADLRKSVELDAKSEYAANALAWLFATCPEAKYRNGKKAVELANRACELSKWKDFNNIDSLAAAQAEVGNFAEAVKWQEKALENPSWTKEEQDDAKERLQLYKDKKPYRDEKK